MIEVTTPDYYMTYLGEALLAIHEDNIPLAGTFAWGKPSFLVGVLQFVRTHPLASAMVDNAEWASGKSIRFGIQYVNYTSLERSFKRSALALCTFQVVSLYAKDRRTLMSIFAAEFYNAHSS